MVWQQRHTTTTHWPRATPVSLTDVNDNSALHRAVQRRGCRRGASIGRRLFLARRFLGHRRLRRRVDLVYLYLFGLARLALATIHLGVGRRHWARLAMLKTVAVGIHDAEVVFGMLIK